MNHSGNHHNQNKNTVTPLPRRGAGGEANNAGDYGGKGAQLTQLTQKGFRVPAFHVLPVSFFAGLAPDMLDLKDQIAVRLEALQTDLQHLFSGKLLAVRSSAVGEDSSQHSFAGQFKTVLNVVPENLPDAVNLF